MTIWVDAHLSPRIARWISANFPATALPLREIGLREAEDDDIFGAARAAVVVVLTKAVTSFDYWSSTAARRRFSGSPAATLPMPHYKRFLGGTFRWRSVCSEVERTWWRSVLPSYPMNAIAGEALFRVDNLAALPIPTARRELVISKFIR